MEKIDLKEKKERDGGNARVRNIEKDRKETKEIKAIEAYEVRVERSPRIFQRAVIDYAEEMELVRVIEPHTRIVEQFSSP